MLNTLGLRKKSYPFDWLWNLDSGLSGVLQIILNDFNGLYGNGAYKQQEHYRFEDEVLVYNKVPSIVHLHSNPLINDAEHNALCRRYDYFIEEMNSINTKHFIYYRSFEEDMLEGKSISIEDSVKRLLVEGKEFMEKIADKYPSSEGKVNLLLVMQSDIKVPGDMVQTLRNELLVDDVIKFSTTINRSDNDLLKRLQWKCKWSYIIIFMTNTPLYIRLNALIFLLFNPVKNKLRNMLSRIM